MSQAKQIVQKSATYAFGNALRGLASFIMLPVYTRYLSPRDYGVIELIGVALDLALLLLGARIAIGIFKFYSDAPTQKEKHQVIGTALVLMAGVHLAAVLLIVLLNRPISAVLNVDSDFGIALSVYSVSSVFSAINEVFFSYLKILDRALTFVSVNLLRLVLQLALNIALIAYLDMKYWGVIWSAVISSAAITTFFAFWILPTTGLHISRVFVRKLTHFSIPIIFASLAMYYITFSSRYYLQYFDNVNAVGIYAVANKFGMMIFSLVAVPFSEYWSARQFDLAKLPTSPTLFGQVFFYLSFILLCAACGLTVTVADLIHIMASSAFWSAIPLIPWLIGAYILQAWGDYFRFGCFHTSNNRYITIASVATVVVITVLYSAWIPSQGALGATRALFVANAVRFGVIYYFSQQLFRTVVPWNRILSCVAYFSGVAALIFLVPISGLAAIVTKESFVLIAILVALATPIFPFEHRQVLRRSLKKAVVRVVHTKIFLR